MIHLAFGCKRTGTVMHEMMHALGIVHEQSRPDRDEFLEVKYGNIKKGNLLNLLSDNPTKWSNTLKQFVVCCRRIV